MTQPYDDNFYAVTIVRHIDGDTTHIHIDYGWDQGGNMTVRWADIDAPEINTTEGLQVLGWVNERMPVGTTFWMKGVKNRKEKYGRYLGRFYDPVSMRCINDQMLELGLARPYRTVTHD